MKRWWFLSFMLGFGLIYLGWILGVTLERDKAKAEARADGYEQGLVDGMNVPRPGPTPEPPSFFDVTPDKASCFWKGVLIPCSVYEELKTAKDHRQTVAANRQNARDWGWNEGYAQGRSDWTALPYDCRRML